MDDSDPNDDVYPVPTEHNDSYIDSGTRFWLVMIGAAAGSFFEFYDYALIVYFADQISDAFFPPHSSQEVSLLEAFGLYGAAYIVRPFGAIYFGWLSDKYGRRHALFVTLLLMGIPTFLMACVPTYSTIGYGATVIVFVLRILQVNQYFICVLFTDYKYSIYSIYIYIYLYTMCVIYQIFFTNMFWH